MFPLLEDAQFFSILLIKVWRLVIIMLFRNKYSIFMIIIIFMLLLKQLISIIDSHGNLLFDFLRFFNNFLKNFNNVIFCSSFGVIFIKSYIKKLFKFFIIKHFYHLVKEKQTFFLNNFCILINTLEIAS